jgi:hypothetical protein
MWLFYFIKMDYVCHEKRKRQTKPTMKREDAYELIADYQPKTVRFRFASVGDKGSIEKIIEFSLTPENYWNLGFGDLVGDNWEDNVISNNNDFRTVLQTVANAVHQFCEIYPQQQILIRVLWITKESCFTIVYFNKNGLK